MKEYREFVKSLRRLYKEKHLITKEKVESLLADNKITAEQAEYILG